MKDYTFAEIGMLIGAGLGGAIAIICFNLWSNILFFSIAGIGIALGVIIGKAFDRKGPRSRIKNEVTHINK